MKKMLIVMTIAALVMPCFASDYGGGGEEQTTVYLNPGRNLASVDGDLSDWAGTNWITMDQTYYGSPTDVSDNSKWAIEWNDADNLIYLGVAIEDSEHNFRSGYTAWNDVEGLEIYYSATDADESAYGGWSASSQQFVVGANGTGGNWVSEGASGIDNGNYAAFATTISGDWIYYEMALLPLDELAVDLEDGYVIAMDVVADTVKDDGNFGMKSEQYKDSLWTRSDYITERTLSSEVVPEPLTISMMALGAIMIRRKKNA